MGFEFKCGTCGEIPASMFTFSIDKPLIYYEAREQERDARGDCDSDD